MRVLVTGGAGFIGSHLVEALLTRGDDVVILDNFDDAYDPAKKERNLSDIQEFSPKRVALVRGDIRDASALDVVLEGVDAVVHLAARAGVRPSLSNPLLYESVNVAGTVSVLDALRRRPGPALVFASSSSVYGAESVAPFREDMPADRPVSPYAASKRAAELLCYSASAAWGQRVSCLRFFTVYGPRQRPDMAIARFVALSLAGRPLPIYGDPEAARDYTWVGDVVAGLIAALDRPQPYAVINIGSGRPVSLSTLVAAVGRATGSSVAAESLPPQPGDVPLTHADIRLAARLLKWTPTTSLDEGLDIYVRWVREMG